jgi:hypothetical protein
MKRTQVKVGRLMKKLNMIAIGLVLICAGCAKNAATSSNSSQGTGITISSARPFMGDSVRFCAAQATTLKSFSWNVLDEDSFDISYSCTPTNSGSCIDCIFDEAGLLTVEVSASTQSGSAYSATQTVEVLDPAQREDQPPVIVCDIKQGATLKARVSNKLALESGSTNFPAGSYNIDCSATQDEDTFSQLTMQMKFGTGRFGSVPAS